MMTPGNIDNAGQMTNFVAKTPSAAAPPGLAPKSQKKASSALLYLGFFLLAVAVLISGGAYLYERMVAGEVVELEKELAQQQARIVLDDLDIMESVTRELRVGRTVFSRHQVLAPLFRFLEQSTLPEVRYQNFTYSQGGNIMMSGEAMGYQAIAQQSDIFSSSSLIEGHIFSGFALTELGRVRFQLQITPIPGMTMYTLAP